VAIRRIDEALQSIVGMADPPQPIWTLLKWSDRFQELKFGMPSLAFRHRSRGAAACLLTPSPSAHKYVAIP
jgi:hypothetical protein